MALGGKRDLGDEGQPVSTEYARDQVESQLRCIPFFSLSLSLFLSRLSPLISVALLTEIG